MEEDAYGNYTKRTVPLGVRGVCRCPKKDSQLKTIARPAPLQKKAQSVCSSFYFSNPTCRKMRSRTPHGYSSTLFCYRYLLEGMNDARTALPYGEGAHSLATPPSSPVVAIFLTGRVRQQGRMSLADVARVGSSKPGYTLIPKHVKDMRCPSVHDIYQ